MFTIKKINTNSIRILAYAIVIALIAFNVSGTGGAFGQSPGLEDNNCYEESDPCDEYGECANIIVCPEDDKECPDERESRKNWSDKSTC